MSLRKVLESGAKCHPPHWMADNLIFETIMGSDSYGVSSGESDKDVYGIVFPAKDLAFPWTAGEILGFGRQTKRFESWQEHHVQALGTSWDFQIYSVITYFNLAMENNPNILDSLFTPRRCILSMTPIGELIRENRRTFLHKGAWHKHKGYAYAQLHKIKTKRPDPDAKRAELVEKYGYDTKFGYHVVRLLLQAEQILAEHDLDLERNREQLKAIRRGEWPLEMLIEWAAVKEKNLEDLYNKSTLRHTPDEQAIKALLMQCLEHHYGDLSKVIHSSDHVSNIAKQIIELAAKLT